MGVTLVLDASAGVEILLDTPIGRSLADDIPTGATWWVPDHYFVEVASALRRAEYRQVIPAAQAVNCFGRLQGATALRRAQIRPLLPEAWRKRRYLTIGDALYVVLAEYLGATLVTADLKLANAASGSLSVLAP